MGGGRGGGLGGGGGGVSTLLWLWPHFPGRGVLFQKWSCPFGELSYSMGDCVLWWEHNIMETMSGWRAQKTDGSLRSACMQDISIHGGILSITLRKSKTYHMGRGKEIVLRP